jgi:hypothetical protein
VDSLLYFAQDWVLNTISYNPFGPNSNTFAEEAGVSQTGTQVHRLEQ